MTHQEIIIIVVTASFASTFGVYVVIKKINQYTRIPENVLNSRRNIQLDYIEPTRPQQIYNYPDLEAQFPILNNTFYDRIPSHWSGNPPSYQTIDRRFINCCLENDMFNLDLILYFILISIIIIVLCRILFYSFKSIYYN